ncbi:MAG: hypothetical protein AAF662_12275, partial [Pseudomonadota bacterium]
MVLLLVPAMVIVPVPTEAQTRLTPEQTAALLFTLRITEEAPIVGNAGIDFDGFAGTDLQLDASSSSHNYGETLLFAWTVVSQPSGSDIELTNADTATPGVTPVLPGAYAFAVTVSDADGNQTVDTVLVNVTVPVPVPNVSAMLTQPVAGKPFAFDGSASYHEADLPFTYQWSLLEQPIDSGLDPMLGTDPEIEVVFDQPGAYSLRLTVSDDNTSSYIDLEPFEVTLYDTILLATGFDDAEFDQANKRIVTLLGRDLNLISAGGQQSVIKLPLDGQAVSVSPDGGFAAVGHDGWVSHINLNTGEVLDTYSVPADVLDIVLDGNGMAHTFPGGQWVRGISVDTSTGQIINGTGTIRGNTRAKLHASGDRIYGADNGLSPSDLERYDLDPEDNSLNVAYDSPYHGDFPFCGDLWMHPAGELALSRCRVVVRTTNTRESDLTFAMQLPEGASPRIRHASVNEFNNEWLIVDRASNWVDSGIDSVRSVDAVTGIERAQNSTPYQQGLSGSRWTAMFVFGVADSARHFVLAVDDVDDPQKYALLVSQSPSASDAANLAPTARVQRYTSIRGQGLVRLDATASSDPENQPLS